MRPSQIIAGITAGTLLATSLMANVAPAPAAALPSSLRGAVHETYAGVAGPTTKVSIGIHLPLRNRAELYAFVHARPHIRGYKQLGRRTWLTPAQFNARYAPLPSDVLKAEASLKSLGFTVVKANPQLIKAVGSVGTINSVFGTKLLMFKDSRGTMHVGTRSRMTVPAALSALHATVLGFGGNVVPVHPMFEFAKSQGTPAKWSYVGQKGHFNRGHQQNRYSQYGDYWFDDLKQAYTASSYLQINGTGTTIATVGLSDFSDADAYAYWAYEGLVTGTYGLAQPPITEHDVYAGSYAFGTGNGTDFEANLDVQQAGGAAPGATIVGVAAPADSNFGFLEAYADIASDNFADVISTSYGGCELEYTAAYNDGSDYTGLLQAYDDVFLQLGSLGTSVMFSSGDEAGNECPDVGYTTLIPSVAFWADDPNVTAVGGTNLDTFYTSGSLASQRIGEAAVADWWGPEDPNYGLPNGYFGSGGGVSTIYAEPDYQTGAGISLSGRGVPDISMHMGGCPEGADLCANQYNEIGAPGYYDSADILAYGGELYGVIGTSASSPEFAGTIATYDSGLAARTGLANPIIYGASAYSGIYYGGIPFFNGDVAGLSTAGPGWNVVTGLGSFRANVLWDGGTTVAGDPQTASNP